MESRRYKKNKVAGAQFAANVRFDDYHIAECRGQIGQSGNVSSEIPAAREEEVYDVKEGELLVCKRNGSMYTDGYAHAFSVINGYPNTHGLTGDDLKQKILGDVAFLGIAETEYSHSKLGSWSEQGFVCVTAGVKTILNEGTEDVYPGQKLMIDIDLTHGRKATRERGIPRSKCRFTIKPAGDDCNLIAEALRLSNVGASLDESSDLSKELTELQRKLSGERKKKRTPEIQKDVDELKKKIASATAGHCGVGGGVKGMKRFLQKYRELNERVIGKALSYGRPGEQIEILIGVRNSI